MMLSYLKEVLFHRIFEDREEKVDLTHLFIRVILMLKLDQQDDQFLIKFMI
jgi:hypothetical protein